MMRANLGRLMMGILITAAAAPGLTQCGSPAETGDRQQIGDAWGDHSDLVPVTVQLDGGRSVECVALLGSRQGGLSCNWEGVTSER